jgi:hypothetical protein
MARGRAWPYPRYPSQTKEDFSTLRSLHTKHKINELDCAEARETDESGIVLNTFRYIMMPCRAVYFSHLAFFFEEEKSRRSELYGFPPSLFDAIISNNIQLKFIAKDVSIQNVSTIHNLFDLIIFSRRMKMVKRQKLGSLRSFFSSRLWKHLIKTDNNGRDV